MNIVVSQSVEDILALAPKPKAKHKMGKLEKRPVKIHMLGQNKSSQEVKKAKKQKKTPAAGIEVIETLEEAPVKQINPEEQQVGYTPEEIDTMVQTANQFSFPYEKLKAEPMPGLSAATDNAVYLPTYEEMMIQDMHECGTMETQPDLDMPADLEQVALQEYLLDASKPMHTDFVLPHQGKRSTFPVYFSGLENKQKVLDALCNEIHTSTSGEPLPVTVDSSLS